MKLDIMSLLICVPIVVNLLNKGKFKRRSNRYSLNQNCWDNLLFSCPPNVGVQDSLMLGGPGDGPEVKEQRWVEVSQQFLSETVGILL